MPFVYPKRPYNLEELKDMSRDNIIERCSDIIVDKNSLLNNIKLFLELSKINRINKILSLDYESSIILDELKEKDLFKRDKVYLIDDYKQIDRNYIDITKLKNIKLIIPNTYAMWNVKFDYKLYCYQYLYKNYSVENDAFSGYYDKETLIEVERISSMIKDFSDNLTDIEKVIIISNYLQKYCKFEESDSISEKELGDPKTALFLGIGVCRTFADATTLLSNNPYLKLKVRNVRSKNHVWNIIELNDKVYQIDNSRAISNGKYTKNDELRTSKFNSEYLLFGENSLKKLNHEDMLFGLLPSNISKEDFDREYISAALEYLDSTDMIDFNYERRMK